MLVNVWRSSVHNVPSPTVFTVAALCSSFLDDEELISVLALCDERLGMRDPHLFHR